MSNKLRALCFSEKCNPKSDRRVELSRANAIEKIVPKHSWFCPDCKSALYWTKDEFVLMQRKPNQQKIKLDQKYIGSWNW